MGQMVIAVYRPHPGRAADLLEEVRRHVPILRGEGLATGREPVVLQAADGTLLEIFEWNSAEAIEAAHTNPVVQAMWARFAAVCDYETLANVPESQQTFSPFTLVEL